MATAGATSFLLLVPLVLGCTTPGPDGEPGPAAPPAPGPSGETVVLDLYDVQDLTLPPESWPGRSGPGEGYEPPTEPPLLAFHGEDLAELIRETIDAPALAAGAAIAFREGGVLIVKAPPATHARIRRLLSALRAAASR